MDDWSQPDEFGRLIRTERVDMDGELIIAIQMMAVIS